MDSSEIYLGSTDRWDSRTFIWINGILAGFIGFILDADGISFGFLLSTFMRIFRVWPWSLKNVNSIPQL